MIEEPGREDGVVPLPARRIRLLGGKIFDARCAIRADGAGGQGAPLDSPPRTVAGPGFEAGAVRLPKRLRKRPSVIVTYFFLRVVFLAGAGASSS
jgi:hypothetical protein